MHLSVNLRSSAQPNNLQLRVQDPHRSSEVGPLVRHTFTLSNMGPFDVGHLAVSLKIKKILHLEKMIFVCISTLTETLDILKMCRLVCTYSYKNVQVNLSWPLQDDSDNWLLYLSEAPYIEYSSSNTKQPCLIDENLIDNLKLDMKRR